MGKTALKTELPPSIPTLTMIGDLPLITPCALDLLRPGLLAKIGRIEQAMARGDKGAAARLALSLESDLGVTNDDRIAALGPTEPWEADLDAAMERAASAGAVPKARIADQQIELPANERGIEPYLLARFDKSKAMLEQTRFRLTDEQKDAHLRTISGIERTRQEWAEKVWRDESTAETIALAEARGAEIDQGKAGRSFSTSRDGLHTLYIARAITHDEYEQGGRYRACYEARTADVGSQMGGLSSGGAHNNGTFVANRYERARMTNLIALIERQLPVQCLDEPAALQMFRAVIANGLTISSFGKARIYARNLKAFRRSLTAAAVTERLEIARQASARSTSAT